ncbi:hypothetical protein Adi01nite_41220 [Amorphoplanes digitatis]|nr:hypothetical protein Adi01nite_41220 [Actinoplanes digitatis]
MLRVMATVSAAALMATAGLIAGPASPASAAPPAPTGCPYSVPTHLPNGGGKLTVLSGGTWLNTGSYADCDRIRSLSAGTVVWMWCQYSNHYNNTWYYGRVEGTTTYGWVSSDRVAFSYTPGEELATCTF